ncbi:MAG: HEAT repeat domain-containing protein [Acidobacteria bacterium]|nr:HEAT repeat domain-containing protein [Acidobacteriota bacterium]
MNCETARKQLPLLVYCELSFDEEEALEQHLEACAGCRAERDALKALARLADGAELTPPAGLLEYCRADLRRRLAGEEPLRRPGWWARFCSWRPVAVAWKSAGALALVALGFFAAWLSSGPAVPFSRPVTSRVRYVEPDPRGGVQIVLEETRQRVLNGRIEDEPIRKLLLAAARDREDPGLRVDSIDILKSQCSLADVRGALLAALRGDPNPGVRLKALEGLKAFADEVQTRKALAQTLLNDDSPNVRTMAIDALVQRKEQDVVGVLQQLLRQENNDYIRERSTRALREMRASVETF